MNTAAAHQKDMQTIIDREKLMRLKNCPACNHPFNLGDPVVLACGAWEGPPRLIHENEAVFDPATATYVERRCHAAKRGRI
ncbi:MAG: hypothetical protein ABIL58_13495 [Pseudomonadota bacterium]